MSYSFGGGGRGQSENDLLKGALPVNFAFLVIHIWCLV